MVTRGLRRMMLGPNLSDSRIVVASQGGDLMSRMARINENKDFVKFSRRQGMHSGFGGMKPSILLIFIHGVGSNSLYRLHQQFLAYIQCNVCAPQAESTPRNLEAGSAYRLSPQSPVSKEARIRLWGLTTHIQAKGSKFP